MTIWFSLRKRLLFLLLGGSVACWLGIMVWSYLDAQHEIAELLDGQLIIEAETLMSLAEDEASEMVAAAEDEHHEERLRFQIWTDEGHLVLRSPGTPSTMLTDADGFSERSDDQGDYPHWRYYSRWDDDQSLRVIVGENHHVRDELSGQIVLQLMIPAIFGLPLLGAWVWVATHRGLQPLNVVAGQIAARDPTRLEPLMPASAPEEVRPLVDSINHLFDRVERTLAEEKQFTADAAHELRTPLAALATQAQVALRARDETERQHALLQLSASAKRAGRLVDQLLTLARLDPNEPPPLKPVSLPPLAEEICALYGTVALDKDIALELEAEPTVVAGDANMLSVLLRNLVDNAVRYTQPGGLVTVAVRDGTLTVTDTGPGIPAAQREAVFRRFHRLAGQETEGSGLGLSIVARIVERLGATVSLDGGEDGRGLRVKVLFPVPR